MKRFVSSAILAAAVGSVSPWGVAPAEGASRRYPDPTGTPFVYKVLPDRELKVFVNYPPGWRQDDRRPALVFFHGGGWVGGGPGVFNEQAAHYSANGIVCILVQYRLLKDRSETLETCVRDAGSALRWVRGHAAELGIAPDRIGAVGGSAGAQLSAAAALLTVTAEAGEDAAISPRPDALILYNPALDNGPGGCGQEWARERYRELSPYHNVHPGAPATLILSGTADKLVPVAMLERFQAAMEKVGARCELRLYEGQPHGFYRQSESDGKYYELTLREIDGFLRSLGWMS